MKGEVTARSGEIRRDLQELREFIRNPDAYGSYHSTTPSGMCIFVDQVEAKVSALVQAATSQALAEWEEAQCQACQVGSGKIFGKYQRKTKDYEVLTCPQCSGHGTILRRKEVKDASSV